MVEMKDQNQPNSHIRKFGPKLPVGLDDPTTGHSSNTKFRTLFGVQMLYIYIYGLHYKYVYTVYKLASLINPPTQSQWMRKAQGIRTESLRSTMTHFSCAKDRDGMRVT